MFQGTAIKKKKNEKLTSIAENKTDILVLRSAVKY